MKKLIYLLLITISVFGVHKKAQAFNLDWTGGYRFEWTEIDRPSLGDPYGRKAYGLNYLYLQPQIMATDGVTINSRFDVLSNQSDAYKNSQIGQVWGGNVDTPADTSTNNTTRSNQGATTLNVSELYLKVSQEYGSLVVGRMPFEFGLGMSHNAGRGAFDHWTETHDMVGYKFISGNMFFMPMLGRSYQQDAGQGNSTTEQMLQIQYDSADSGSLLGLLIERKNASLGSTTGNGNWLTSWKNFSGDSTATQFSDFSYQRTSFILGKQWQTFGFKIEGGFAQGETGVLTSAGKIRMNGYGLATEIYYKPLASAWDYNIRLGMATGDDPSTVDFEGYQFNKNYDVAFLMFNHRLGQFDALKTSVFKDGNHDVGNSFDDEMISNAYYISPRVKYVWGDKLDIYNTVTFAQLLNSPKNSVDFKKDLGIEWDFELVYKPREKIQWVNQFGYLFAGSAFQNGSANLSNNNTFGFASKAAINF